jgi:hypothetical protein
MCVKNASNETRGRSAGASATSAIGTARGELGLLHVLQHDPLRALLADDALVVRQVERGRLHAPVRVAGGEHDVHDADRGQRAERRVAERRVDRQVVLDRLQLPENRASFAVSWSSRA